MEPSAGTVTVDPLRVPVYPVVRLELRTVSEDVVEASVDGRVIATGDPESCQATALQAAAGVAQERPVRAVRVRLAGFDAVAAEGIVDASGQLYAGSPDGAAPRRRAWSAPVKLILLTMVAAAAAGGLMWVAVSSGALGSLGLGAQPAATPTVPRPVATELPVPAPPGWGSVATWARPLGTASAVCSVRDLVFIASTDGGAVVAVSGSDGHEVWSSGMPGAIIGAGAVGGPVVARMDGRDVVAAWTSSELVAWEPDTGRRVGVWPLPPDGSSVVAAGSSVLVLGQSRHVGVLTNGALRSRVLAAGASAVGVLSDGSLVAASDGRAWVTHSDQLAGSPATLAAPEGTSWWGVVGLAGDRLIVAYSASADTVVLRAFDVSTWSTLWTSSDTTALAGSSANNVPPLALSPDGGWGVYGATWLDVATGQVKSLPSDWSTTAIGQRFAFGTVNVGPAVVDSVGDVKVPAAHSSSPAASPSSPVAVTDAGMAMIVANDGNRLSLYAVPEDGHR